MPKVDFGITLRVLRRKVALLHYTLKSRIELNYCDELYRLFYSGYLFVLF